MFLFLPPLSCFNLLLDLALYLRARLHPIYAVSSYSLYLLLWSSVLVVSATEARGWYFGNGEGAWRGEFKRRFGGKEVADRWRRYTAGRYCVAVVPVCWLVGVGVVM